MLSWKCFQQYFLCLLGNSWYLPLTESGKGINFWLLAWAWEHLCLLGYSLLQGIISTGSSINCWCRSGIADCKLFCETPAELRVFNPSPKPNQALHDFKLRFGYLVHPLMCHYESFITCSGPSWPLMIQQNYFISALPHSGGWLRWGQQQSPFAFAWSSRLALEMRPETRGSFPAWNPAFQPVGVRGLKWHMQMWREAAAEAWPQNKEADGGRAGVLAGQRGSRRPVQPFGAERQWGRSRCAESGSVPLCLSALRSRRLLHVLLCSSGTLRTRFWPLLPPAEGGFAKQQAKGAGGKSRRSANLPLPPSAELRQG